MEKKEIDDHKLDWHPERLKQWMENGDCPPVYFEIGLTNICNHECIFCGFDYARGRDSLETNSLIKTVGEMGEYGVKSILYAGAGEPFLHKDFSLIIRKTKEAGIDVAFSTNTVLFNKNNAEQTLPHTSWIRFSLDAATPKTHSYIHHTSEKDFPRILKNLEEAVRVKQNNKYDTILGVQFLLLEENASEVFKLAEICKNLGVDMLQVKPYSKHPPSNNAVKVNYNNFPGLEERLQEFSTRDFKVIFRTKRIEELSLQKEYPICLSLSFWGMINERGDVIPCDLFYNLSDSSYGNIYANNFSEIWDGEKRKKVLNQIKNNGTKYCKEGCRGDLINKYLWSVKEKRCEIKEPIGKYPKHINFI